MNLFFPPDDLASEMSISTNDGVLASAESDAAAMAGRIQEEIWVLQAQQGDEEAFGRLTSGIYSSWTTKAARNGAGGP